MVFLFRRSIDGCLDNRFAFGLVPSDIPVVGNLDIIQNKEKKRGKKKKKKKKKRKKSYAAQ